MVIVEWEGFKGELLGENVAIQMSDHAMDRSTDRDGRPMYISKYEVEKAIKQVENKLEGLSSKFKTFVIKTKDKLNIVGSLFKKGSDFIFKVITLMRKDNFKSKPEDKVLVTESYLDKQNKDNGSKQIQNTLDQISLIKADDKAKTRKPFDYGSQTEWTIMLESRKKELIKNILKDII